jgi:hypothetical protein
LPFETPSEYVQAMKILADARHDSDARILAARYVGSRVTFCIGVLKDVQIQGGVLADAVRAELVRLRNIRPDDRPTFSSARELDQLAQEVVSRELTMRARLASLGSLADAVVIGILALEEVNSGDPQRVQDYVKGTRDKIRGLLQE